MQSSIRSLDKRLDGNWVSIFVRLGLRGRNQMPLNTETRNVSICIVSIRTDVSVELTIFDDIPQFAMQALVNTKEHGMERYPSDPAGRGMAINLLRELAMEEDVKRLSEYCSDTKYDKY
jgi:hypothetical protein